MDGKLPIRNILNQTKWNEGKYYLTNYYFQLRGKTMENLNQKTELQKNLSKEKIEKIEYLSTLFINFLNEATEYVDESMEEPEFYENYLYFDNYTEIASNIRDLIYDQIGDCYTVKQIEEIITNNKTGNDIVNTFSEIELGRTYHYATNTIYSVTLCGSEYEFQADLEENSYLHKELKNLSNNEFEYFKFLTNYLNVMNFRKTDTSFICYTTHNCTPCLTITDEQIDILAD